MKEETKFNILLYGYSELAINCLCGFRNAIIAQLSYDYDKTYIEYENYDPIFVDKEEENSGEHEAKSQLYKEISHIKMVLKLLKIKGPIKGPINSETRKVLEEILHKEILEEKIKDSEIRKVLEEILHKVIFEKNIEDSEIQDP